jgi:hypothetical protein
MSLLLLMMYVLMDVAKGSCTSEVSSMTDRAGYVLRVTCYVLRVTCYVLRVTCYVLRVTCYVFLRGGGAWRLSPGPPPSPPSRRPFLPPAGRARAGPPPPAGRAAVGDTRYENPKPKPQTANRKPQTSKPQTPTPNRQPVDWPPVCEHHHHIVL